MDGQVTEVKNASRMSATKVSTNKSYGNLFKQLNRQVTLKAIRLIKKEMNEMSTRGGSALQCGCHQRRVMGLSCACEIQMYVDSVDLWSSNPYILMIDIL
jgi:hypothetical protein